MSMEGIVDRSVRRADEICVFVNDDVYKRNFIRHYQLGAIEQKCIDRERVILFLKEHYYANGSYVFSMDDLLRVLDGCTD